MPAGDAAGGLSESVSAVMIRILRVIEIVRDSLPPDEWVPFDLKLPSGNYWFRKNANFGSKRIRYDAAERSVTYGERTVDAVYLSGEVKRIAKRETPSIGGP